MSPEEPVSWGVIVARRRPASPGVCLRWLPIWLPEIWLAWLINLVLSGCKIRAIDAAAVELTVPVDSLICRTVPAPKPVRRPG